MTPRSTLIGPLAQLHRSLQQKQGESTNRSEFCHLWGIDKLIFWSHYVLKQLIGRSLLCSIRHVMVNCLRNADCWKVSPLSGSWCELCFVNTGANHVELRKANRWFRDVHGELVLLECITCGVCKTTFHNDFYPCNGACSHSETFNGFCFIFPFCLFTIFFLYGQTDFLHFAVNEIASMVAILVQEWFFFSKKKKIHGNKESLFVINHLIYNFSIYI